MEALTVTDGALRNLAARLRNLGDSKPSDDICFRLRVNDTGDQELALDRPIPEDKTYQFDGQTVLVTSPVLAATHGARTFDVNEAGDFILI